MKSKLKLAALGAAASLATVPAFAADEVDDMVTKIENGVTVGSTLATTIVTAMIGLLIYRIVSRFVKRGSSAV